MDPITLYVGNRAAFDVQGLEELEVADWHLTTDSLSDTGVAEGVSVWDAARGRQTITIAASMVSAGMAGVPHWLVLRRPDRREAAPVIIEAVKPMTVRR